MAILENIVPKEIFQEIAEALKKVVTVTSFTQSGNKTTLFCDAVGINLNSFLLFNCGDLKGYRPILEVYPNRVVIQYSGEVELGTIKTEPYFNWGNLIEGQVSLNKINEFPLIFMILPKPYVVNVDDKDVAFIDDTFRFLVIDRYATPNGTRKTMTDDIFDTTVNRMSELSLNFINEIKSSRHFINSSQTFRRSEEIPFVITLQGDRGSKEQIGHQVAGCYVEASVKIKKKFKCN